NQIEVQRAEGEHRMYESGNHSGMNSAADDHRRHRKQNCPQGRRKHTRFESLRTLNEVLRHRIAQQEVLDLLTGSDEEEHSHALRQRDEKGREKSPQKMWTDPLAS